MRGCPHGDRSSYNKKCATTGCRTVRSPESRFSERYLLNAYTPGCENKHTDIDPPQHQPRPPPLPLGPPPKTHRPNPIICSAEVQHTWSATEVAVGRESKNCILLPSVVCLLARLGRAGNYHGEILEYGIPPAALAYAAGTGPVVKTQHLPRCAVTTATATRRGGKKRIDAWHACQWSKTVEAF